MAKRKLLAGKAATIPNLDFRPDWVEIGTVAELTEQIGDIKLNGPGWYLYKRGTALVIPLDGPQTYHQKRDPNEKFRYCYWDHSPAFAFNELVNAPTRVDERD